MLVMLTQLHCYMTGMGNPISLLVHMKELIELPGPSNTLASLQWFMMQLKLTLALLHHLESP